MLILKQTTDINRIKEEEYGLGQKVQFTELNSCIGVCAMNQSKTQVIGIHLVHRHTDDSQFSVKDMEAVIKTLTHYCCDDKTVIVIGDISSWAKSNKAPLERLRTRYPNRREYQLQQIGGGLGAELRDGNAEPVWS